MPPATSVIFDYEPIIGVDSNDVLQRFGHVKVEATSFTVSEPHQALKIDSVLHENANSDQRTILETQFDVKPFEIKTIRLERIFIDKIFAAEFYYDRQMCFDVAKHLYDIYVMSELNECAALLQDQTVAARFADYKRTEEMNRIGSDLDTRAFADFRLANDALTAKSLKSDFERMQRIYVYDTQYLIDFDDALATYDNVPNVGVRTILDQAKERLQPDR